MAISISVVQRKGGVGKTTISTLLAGGWAIRGLRVLLIDTDSQGDAGRMIGVAPNNALYDWLAEGKPSSEVTVPISAESITTPDMPMAGAMFLLPSGARTFAIPSVTDNPFLLAERLQEFNEMFDVIIIDTAPTLSALDAYVYLASDYFVYVTECEELSIAGLTDGLSYVQRFSKHRATYNVGVESQVLGVVPNKMRPNTINHRVNLQYIAQEYGGLVWPPITQRTKFPESNNYGQLIYAYAPTSGEANDAWRLVDKAEAVLNELA